jgi:Chemotaxis protein; stimulates methylation of MCP proteins
VSQDWTDASLWCSIGPMSYPQQTKILVSQGSYHVTDNPEVVLYTPLGSCVAACLYDPVAKVGGMNHFLLPHPPSNDASSNPALFGVNSMPLLLGAMIDAGARPSRIRAKLYGGSRLIFGGTNIGLANALVARDFLERNRVLCLGGISDTGHGASVSFVAALGRISGHRFRNDPASPFSQEGEEAALSGSFRL